MVEWIPPGLIFIFGAAFVPLLKGRLRNTYLLSLPLLAFLNLINMPEGKGYVLDFLDYQLILCRVDNLSLPFGYIFVIITFTILIFSLHLKENKEFVIGLVYGGSAIGAVFAGDFITLFIFWEIMTVSATFIIWGSKTKASQGAGFRYIIVHLFGGVCLLVGIVIQVYATGTTEFNWIGLNGMGSYFILLGFAINAAVPPLHAWLPDAYPEAPVTGAGYLTAFTTKTAVYVLARGFAGTEFLAWAGAFMALYGVTYAMLQNDMRRLLSYHIVSQVGFMVCGIGLGTAMAINGAVAHAFCHILYKALLFMSTGSIIYITGKRLLSDLSGSNLYKKMPVTLLLYTIGAFSISGVPLMNGFISKGMTMYAAGLKLEGSIQLMLSFASVGTFLSVALKLCYFAWFGENTGRVIEAREPPINMLAGMGFTAFLCILIGIHPKILYDILPFAVDYQPFKTAKVISTILLLAGTGLGFMLIIKKLAPVPRISLDTDWIYRKGAKILISIIETPITRLVAGINRVVFELIPSSLAWASKNPLALLKIALDTIILKFAIPEKKEEIIHRIMTEKENYPEYTIKRLPIGTSVLLTVLFMFIYLLIYYVR